ncbi:MAG: dephospho-CoA kinase, partial [Lachnospiraceae bacterium]|nr:dephospho-CoA kinase [Lachnospiraceae bacterium]
DEDQAEAEEAGLAEETGGAEDMTGEKATPAEPYFDNFAPAAGGAEEAAPVPRQQNTTVGVIVNNAPVILTGKSSYVFVDVFDRIDFDLSKPQGKSVATILNGREAQYMEPLKDGDVLEIYWRN